MLSALRLQQLSGACYSVAQPTCLDYFARAEPKAESERSQHHLMFEEGQGVGPDKALQLGGLQQPRPQRRNPAGPFMESAALSVHVSRAGPPTQWQQQQSSTAAGLLTPTPCVTHACSQQTVTQVATGG